MDERKDMQYIPDPSPQFCTALKNYDLLIRKKEEMLRLLLTLVARA
jgi:hypothetical protein